VARTIEEVTAVSVLSGLSRRTDDNDPLRTLLWKSAVAPASTAPATAGASRPNDKSRAHYDGDHSKNLPGCRHLVQHTARTMSRDHSSGIRAWNNKCASANKLRVM